MCKIELSPIQVYEFLLLYKILGKPIAVKFCYQSISDSQAVMDAIAHANAVSKVMEITVLSLEVFCLELGFRGLDPDEPDLIVNRHDRQIYDSSDLDTSLIEELPLRMEERTST